MTDHIPSDDEGTNEGESASTDSPSGAPQNAKKAPEDTVPSSESEMLAVDLLVLADNHVGFLINLAEVCPLPSMSKALIKTACDYAGAVIDVIYTPRHDDADLDGDDGDDADGDLGGEF